MNVEYKVIGDLDDLDTLSARVTEAIKEGWCLVGGVTAYEGHFGGPTFAQAMIMYGGQNGFF